MIRRKKPLRRRPKTERQKLDAEALKLWGLLVRERDVVCRVQLASKCRRVAEHPHHMVKKSKSGATRFLPENGLGICAPCHAYIHDGHCLDEAQVYRDCGVDYDALMLRARTRVSRAPADLKLVVLDLKARLREMRGE